MTLTLLTLSLLACTSPAERTGAISTTGIHRQAHGLSGIDARFDAPGVLLRAGSTDADVGDAGDAADSVILRFQRWGRASSRLSGLESVGDVDPTDDGTQVSYDFGDVVEWWKQEPGGLQQGWTVNALPVGDGDLVFDVEVEGAEVSVGDDGVVFSGATRTWNYGLPKAWDADGVELDAWLEDGDGGVRVVVDAEGARVPVVVDPLLTTAAWMVESDQDSAYFGRSVASAGDVNGDGYQDVVVGAPNYDNGQTDEGRAYVYLGSAAGLATSASWTAESDQFRATFGISVAAAGDVNGDGYGDVVVGADCYTNGQNCEGGAYLYLGSAAGLATSAAWTAEPDQTNAWFGYSVASAGDVNGDGYADVVVGARNYDNGSDNEGRAYVYLGSSSGLETTAAWTAESDQHDAYFGYSVASAGDVNGDGYDDLVVGAVGYSNGQSGEGQAYLYLGSAAGLAMSAAWTAESDQTFAYFGTSVASAGDVNGDGYADVVVGISNYDNGSTDNGRAYLYLGSPAGLAMSAAWTAESDQDFAYFGASVASAGDVNGDGYADVVVGAFEYDNGSTDEGQAFMYLGSASGLTTSAAWTAESDQDYAYFGLRVATAGDINGDGYSDVVVGALYYDNGSTDEGAAYLYLGSADFCYQDLDADGYGDGSVPTIAATSLDCTNAGESPYGTDCDDGDASRSPGITEIPGDGLDQDCDAVDDCYRDADGDAHGTSSTFAGSGLTCANTGEAPVGDDCDDASSTVYPTAPEVIANGIDEDCDGHDNCYANTDGDGYGATALVVTSDLDCDDAGEASVNGDCNDTSVTVYPLALEITADGIDQDCDGGDTCYVDEDGDSYGTAALVPSADLSCADPGEAATSDDCDDASVATYPAASEITADGIDQDCDGGDTCYADADEDTFGTASLVPSADLSCTDLREAATSGDCDDASATVYPLAPELTADGIDQDCDGKEECYADTDEDTFGTADLVYSEDLTCESAGFSTVDTDCNDDDAPTIYPLAPELTADGLDQNCDDLDLCYVDADADGYGLADTILGDLACTGSALVATDCNDSDPTVHPDAPELTADGIDQDCDSGDTCYTDADHDGYGDDLEATQTLSDDLDCADLGEAWVNGDCDDASARVRPQAPETPANGVDEDCDGSELCYVDEDGDGFGSVATEIGGLNCSIQNTDCDDQAPAVAPGATETCNGIDDDCDGAIDDGLHCTGAIPLLGCATVTSPDPGFGAVVALLAVALRRRSFRRRSGRRRSVRWDVPPGLTTQTEPVQGG